ncbi:hypothetical protein [Kingella oralis]|uniref:hypothetical protein n=1 Tax=Kingella oralis TaxID=505 RepID=UPI002D7E92D9|nr:hypothetical protein [Kingella oralis]
MTEQNPEQAEDNQKKLDLDDWSLKYDCVIPALSQEYYSYLETVRQADEKANKYLVVISIFIAGFFTLLASPLVDNLKFQSNPLTGHSFLSYSFIILSFISGAYGMISVKSLSVCLDFVETRKLPDLEQKLKQYGESNYIEFKHYLIECYQEAINYTQHSISIKQDKIRLAAKQVHWAIILMACTILLLFIIKLVS